MSIIVDIYRIYPYIPFFPVESKKLKNFSKEDFFEFNQGHGVSQENLYSFLNWLSKKY